MKDGMLMCRMSRIIRTECQGAEYEGWNVKVQKKDGMSRCRIWRMEWCQGADNEGWSVKVHNMKDGMSRCRIWRMECQGAEYEGLSVNWCRICRMECQGVR